MIGFVPTSRAHTSRKALAKKSCGRSGACPFRSMVVAFALSADVLTARPMARAGDPRRAPRYRTRLQSTQVNAFVIFGESPKCPHLGTGAAQRSQPNPVHLRREIWISHPVRDFGTSDTNVRHRTYDFAGQATTADNDCPRFRPTVLPARGIEPRSLFGPSIPPEGVESCIANELVAGLISSEAL